jgi:hypothetical protein
MLRAPEIRFFGVGVIRAGRAFSETELFRPTLAKGIPYIAKPFRSSQLNEKIREVLDEPKTQARKA